MLASKSFFAVLACGEWRDHQYAPWRSTPGRQPGAEKNCVLERGFTDQRIRVAAGGEIEETTAGVSHND